MKHSPIIELETCSAQTDDELVSFNNMLRLYGPVR